jgi:RNA polymerase sigma-70 factor, ECF subfamily
VKAARPYGCNDHAVLDELVQDTYVRICADGFKVLRGFKAQHPAAIYSLVQAVAYSTAVDEFRSQTTAKRGGTQRPVALDSLIGGLSGGKSPENQLERQLVLDRIDAHLNTILPEATRERDKTIFWLHFRQGYTAAEIAKIKSYRLTAKGVESLLQRMIRDLRARFGEVTITPRPTNESN